MAASKPSWDAVLSPKAGWASLVVGPEGEIDEFLKALPAHRAVTARVLRGDRCASKAALLHEWAAALQFPCYFGGNWDAFEECLSDRGWLAGDVHVVVLTATERILEDQQGERSTFLHILKAVAEGSERPALRVVFQCEPAGEQESRALLAGEGIRI